MPTDSECRLSGLKEDLKALEHYLSAERGLAANTVQAYRRDLEHYTDWATEANGNGLASYLQPTLRELGHYLTYLQDLQLAPPSVARHLVALKVFYRFLKLEERTTASAVELLSSPSLWERIPQVLSPANVENLLASPLTMERFGLRDRA